MLFWNRCLMDSSFHLVRMKLISNSKKWLLSVSRNGNRSGVILSTLLTCTLRNSKYILVRWHPYQMECLVVELSKVNWFPQESYLWLDNQSRTDRKKLNACVSQWKILKILKIFGIVYLPAPIRKMPICEAKNLIPRNCFSVANYKWKKSSCVRQKTGSLSFPYPNLLNP